MELWRNGHAVVFVALAAGATTSGWWARRTAGDANIFNHCCKRKKICQSELFIINKAISLYGKAFQCPCNALLKFLCMALHSVVPNGDVYPKLSVGYSICFSRISFFPRCIHLITYVWDCCSFCHFEVLLEPVKDFHQLSRVFIKMIFGFDLLHWDLTPCVGIPWEWFIHCSFCTQLKS